MELEMDGGGHDAEAATGIGPARLLAMVAVLVTAVCLVALPVVVSAAGSTALRGMVPLLGLLATAMAVVKVAVAGCGAVAELLARRRELVAATSIE